MEASVKARIEQIRERLAAHREEVAKYHNHEWAKGDALHYYEAPDDVDFLLSLVKSQEVLARELALIVDVGTCDDPGTALSKLHKKQHVAAASMRSACVEKVKRVLVDHDRGSTGEPCGDFMGCDCGAAFDKAEFITALESLSIEQPKE